MAWTPPATGRYSPKSGTLHFHPGERCNLDDSDREMPVTTIEQLQELPPDTTFCKQPGCVFGEEVGQAATVWDPAYSERWPGYFSPDDDKDGGHSER